MKTIDEIRAALSKMHKRACGDTSQVYMSVPADYDRDADLILAAAIDELAGLRAGMAVLDKFSTDGHTNLGRAALQAIADFYKAVEETIQAQPLPLGCVHGRSVGVHCPHCLGIGSGR